MRLKNILKIINMKNINQGISTFNKAVQDFGNSMDSMTRELSTDIEKSNDASKIREQRNQENLDKIWGKKKWDVKSVKWHTRIQVDFSPGKNKYADFVV